MKALLEWVLHTLSARVTPAPEWQPVQNVGGALPPCLCCGYLYDPGSTRFGSCIRVDTHWILTAHHTIDIPDLANRFRVRFGYLGTLDKGIEYTLDPGNGGFFSSLDGIQGLSGYGFDLDYVFIRLRGARDDDPHRQIATLRPDRPPAGERAYIPFPLGRNPLTLAVERPWAPADAGTVVELDRDHVFHKCSTDGGASGAPILDSQWRLIGMHTHRNWDTYDDSRKREAYWGTNIERIIEDAGKRHFDAVATMETFAGRGVAPAPPAPVGAEADSLLG